ncbi:hypothetical protein ACFOY2_05140 [Nonomuraea purpurea]|uniref:Uncharacterized protein n=1 Tax=Nonomuraea purpurea TaxID=1849276 RepID=A0ABV8G062_9ACTN
MTPAEVIEKALRQHFELRLKPSAIEQAQRGHPLHLSGAEAEDAARIAVDALAGAGLVAVSADLREALKLCGRLIACHSRDWGQDASDATLWAILCGWECEEHHIHDDICGGSGALRQVADRFGWDEAHVERIRRLRRAVAALPEEKADA